MNAAHSLQQAAAGAAGDTPTSETGSAEARTNQVAGEAGDAAQNFQPDAQTDAQADAIIHSGEQQYQQDVIREINTALQFTQHACTSDACK